MPISDSAARPPASDPTTLPVHGIWPPLLTPLDAELAIDHARLLEHARWCLAQGCHGVGLFGTTGEASSFSVAERCAALEHLVEGGIDPARIMVGTGCCALTDTVALNRHALALGVTLTLVLPPFYYKGVSDAGLLRSYAEVIERSADERLRVVLYHFPRMSATPLSLELVGALRERFPETVVGVKDSSGDWDNTRALIERFPGLAILPGTETLLLDALKAGGGGCITATANLNPRAIRAVFDAWLADDGRAGRRQESITLVRRAIETHPLVAALKALLAHYRAEPAWRRVRPPLVELEPGAGETLIGELEALGFELGGSGA